MEPKQLLSSSRQLANPVFKPAPQARSQQLLCMGLILTTRQCGDRPVAKYFADEFNRGGPPKHVDFIEPYCVELHKRPGSPMYNGEATVVSLKGSDHCLSFCFSAFPCGSTALTEYRCNQWKSS
eukprot:SAG22_NODE_138_length_18031_cov_5.796621_23_plen_124_part_00